MPKFTKPSSLDIIGRMKQLTATDTDAALARYLGITPPALVQWRVKNIMPMTYCIQVAEQTGASLDYIYLGIEKEAAQLGAALDRLLLELALQRRLPDTAGGVGQLATRIAGDYATMFKDASAKARRSDLSVEAVSLIMWLADRGGEAEDVSVEPGIIDEGIRHGLLQRVTVGTGDGELLVLTPAGTDLAGASH
jgi:hypothetical protein